MGNEDAEIVFAVHALVGIIEGLGVGEPAFLLIENIGFGSRVVDNDAGAYGSGLGDTFIGDLDAGEMAAAVLGDEADLAERRPLSNSPRGGEGLGGHGHADGETEGAVVKDFGLLVIKGVN